MNSDSTLNQVTPFDVNLPYPTEINGIPMTAYIDWMKSCYYISVTGHPALSVLRFHHTRSTQSVYKIVGRHRDDWDMLQWAGV